MTNIKDQVFFVGQKAFIKNKEGKLLVLLDPLAGLDLPGGKVQADEDDLKTSLKREVREETGLEIDVEDVFLTWRFHYPIDQVEEKFRDTRTNGNIYRVGYACTLLGNNDVNLSVEHAESRWIDKNELDQLKSWGGDYKAVEYYFSKFDNQ